MQLLLSTCSHILAVTMMNSQVLCPNFDANLWLRSSIVPDNFMQVFYEELDASLWLRLSQLPDSLLGITSSNAEP